MARLFTAIPFPEADLSRFAAFSDWLRTNAGTRYMPPRNFHLTLLFLGEVPQALLPELFTDFKALKLGVSPFALSYGGLGVFPPHGKPRVVYVPLLTGLYESQELHAALAFGLGRYISKDPGRFEPHVTVGRNPFIWPLTKQGSRHPRLPDLPSCHGDIMVTEIVMLSSSPSAGMRLYEVVCRKALDA